MAQAVIAVVDDEPIVLKSLSLLLKVGGYEVIPWSIAATACEMISERQPDLVTLDLAMQGDWTAGLKVLECLHADPGTSTIPVIIISATADTLQDEDKRLAEFSYARLVKPFGAHELQHLVAAALKVRSLPSHEETSS